LPVRAVATGDVVLFRSPEDGRTALLKRCVALPGERRGGRVVPAGTLFLVGDRRFATRASSRLRAGRARRVVGASSPCSARSLPGTARVGRALRAVE
jgi:hypothetical protein